MSTFGSFYWKEISFQKIAGNIDPFLGTTAVNSEPEYCDALLGKNLHLTDLPVSQSRPD